MCSQLTLSRALPMSKYDLQSFLSLTSVEEKERTAGIHIFYDLLKIPDAESDDRKSLMKINDWGLVFKFTTTPYPKVLVY